MDEGHKPKGHPRDALSAVAVRNQKKPGRYADGKGLYLVVDPSGAKRWMLRMVVSGRRRDIGLGSESKLSLADARKEAQRLREQAHAGLDPVAERKKAKQGVPTFEKAANTVHADHSPAWRNVKHRAQWINTLKEYAFPVIGAKQVNAIETADVLRVLSPIWLAKPETARRVRQRIGTVLDWAKAAGYRVGENPVDGVSKGLPKHADSKQHHAALPYTKVPAFIETLRAADATNATKRAFEFLVLSASRVGEVVAMKKAELDLEEAVWTCPAERMKAKKAHRVPLTPRMVELLKQSIAESDSDYVFAGLKAKSHLSTMAFLMLLRRLKVDATAHGFRSAFRMWAAEMTSHPREIAELALAHVNKDRVEAAYQRSDLFLKRRQLMEEWTEFVTTPPAVTDRKVTTIGETLAAVR